MQTNRIKHKIRPTDGAKTGKLRGEADIELRTKKTLPNQAKIHCQSRHDNGAKSGKKKINKIKKNKINK